MEDLEIAQSDVRHNVKVPLNDNEFGALVSLAFNIGGSALAHSTLVRRLNKGDRIGAATEFESFVNGHIGGRRVKLRGLSSAPPSRTRNVRGAARAVWCAMARWCWRAARSRSSIPPIEVDHVGPPPPPQHFYYPPYPWSPPPTSAPAGAEEPAVVEADVAVPVPVGRPALTRASLVAVATGAAVGVVPATQAPATQDFMAVVGDIWQRIGGPDLLGSPMAWSRWFDAFGSGVVAIFHGGDPMPLLSYLSEFVRSHEAMIAVVVSIALMLFRIALRVSSPQPDRQA